MAVGMKKKPSEFRRLIRVAGKNEQGKFAYKEKIRKGK
jgi:hypothetical protein